MTCTNTEGNRKYSSCGTIRATVRFADGARSELIQFTPDSDHMIKHENKRYAAFVSESPNSNDAFSLPLKDDGYGSHSISFEPLAGTEVAVAIAVAATSQVKVKVEIQNPNNGNKLTAITLSFQ